MDTQASQPTTPAGASRNPSWVRVIAAVCVLVGATSASAQTRQSGRRVVPGQPFETVWVIDRAMSEEVVWQSLVDIAGGPEFQPVVLHGGEDLRWTASLVHLLGMVPDGESIWVTDGGTVFDVDSVVDPSRLHEANLGPRVYSATDDIDDVAALIAMRTDGRLVFEPIDSRMQSDLIGIDGTANRPGQSLGLRTRAAAIAHANSLAEGSVVMVVGPGPMPPEHILWAHQRDALILVVEPPQYSIYDDVSEFLAVEVVDRQIRDGIQALIGGTLPEALVIAGDWHEIPFRYPIGVMSSSTPESDSAPGGSCPNCDNGIYEASADLVYANLDGDPLGLPDVPVGRLMSPYRDLLAIQSVLGVWSEHSAFAPAADGVFLGLFGTGAGHRRDMLDRWRDEFPNRLWTAVGPEDFERGYRLDQDAFFDLAGRADIVIAHAHGHPDALSPDGSPFNLAFSGSQLVDTIGEGAPGFWFLHACSTGKPDRRDMAADQTLLVGLQSRLAFGSLMAVEVLAGGSGDPYWWTEAVEEGLPVGELVRRFVVAGATAYLDGGTAPSGMPATTGSPRSLQMNAVGVLSWVGDPLTEIGS